MIKKWLNLMEKLRREPVNCYYIVVLIKFISVKKTGCNFFYF